MPDDVEVTTLLAELDREREKFTRSDKSLMQGMVNQLVDRGVYPRSTPMMAKHGYTHLEMVGAWGARWHEWRGHLECPLCGADLRNHETGPPGKREIGWYREDVTSHYICPDCQGVFGARFAGLKPPTRAEIDKFFERERGE